MLGRYLQENTSNANTKVHLLDSDAVAIECAAKNVSTKTQYQHLADCWRPQTVGASEKKPHSYLSERKKFSMIVSNPPVHRGQPDDFRVLTKLVEGGASRLKKGGSLWIVSQEQIPVGVLLGKLKRQGVYSKVYCYKAAGGKFVCWRGIVQ